MDTVATHNIIENFPHYISETRAEAEKSCALAVQKEIAHALEDDLPVLFLVSGGSVMKIVERIDPSALTDRATIGVVDERYDPSNKASNCAQLMRTNFCKQALARGCSIIDTTTQRNINPEELAESYESKLRAWRRENPKGVIVVILGAGSDGHTAGIFPFLDQPDIFSSLFEGDKWVVSYDVGEKSVYRQRITTTLTFFREISFVAVFFAGIEKTAVHHVLFQEEGSIVQAPIRGIRLIPRGGVYTDKEVISGNP